MDSAIQDAIHLIDSGRFRVLSLDIFDTLVWREFPTPADLFLALGHSLVQSGRLHPSVSAAGFAAERVEAERLARLSRPGDAEVTLAEIYAHFPPCSLVGKCADSVLLAELTMERERTHVDESVKTLVEHALERGLQIACVSDTYFPGTHLQSILPVRPKFLLASCEFRKSKTAGLHKELVRLSGVPAARILHIGDNHQADWVAAKRFGLDAIWRPRFPEAEEKRIEGELPSFLGERAVLFHKGQGDGGLTRVRSSALGEIGRSANPYNTWGASVLGPTIAPFCRWVLDRCQEEQIDTVLCLMREGRALKAALDAFDEPLNILEFFTSRFALIHASILSGSAEEMKRYLIRPRPTLARDLLSPLNLSPAAMGIEEDTVIGPDRAARLAEKIAKDASLRALVVAASGEARRRFLHYWRKQVPHTVDKVAIVDLGYSGTIQKALQEILDHEGIPCRTHGLYLVTGSGARRVQAIAPAEGYLAHNGQPLSIAHSFMRSPELVEQALMCDLGTTLGYDADGEPMLGEQLITESQRSQVASVQEGMRVFTKHFAALSHRIPIDALALRPFSEAILIRSLTNPTPGDLEAFGSWKHDENLGSKRTRSLVATDLDEEYLQHASAHQWASLPSSDTYWIFGAAQTHSPAVGEAVKNILLRKVQPSAFNLSNVGLPIHFFWNDGEEHRADQEYRLSNRRTAWTRFSLQLDHADIREIGFSVGRPGDLIDLSAVLLRLQQDGAATTVLRKPPCEFETFGLEALDSERKLYRVTDIAGWAAAVEEIRDFTGVVHIDLLFSHFERNATCPC